MQMTSTGSSVMEQGSVPGSQRLDEVNALAGLFTLFGRCLEEEADRDLILMLRGTLRAPLESLGLQFEASFLDTPVDTLREAMAEEYTGLFVAPGCISPYASVFETGCMFKEPADRAIEAYRAAGWDYRHRLSGEFPDHVGTMVGFCGLLAQAEAASLTAGEMTQAEDYRQQRESFLIEQLGSWAPGWCQRAARAALHPFYAGVLRLLEQLLWTELAQLVDRRRLRELMDLNRREPKRLDYDADFRKASGL